MYNDKLKQRFWSKVDVRSENECWEWQAGKSHGYGTFKLGVDQPAGAHRVCYEITNGPIPEGFHILHKCDNPPCVNPKHLFVGNNKANVADAVRKGRLIGVKRKRRKGLKHKKGLKRYYVGRIARDRINDLYRCGAKKIEIARWLGMSPQTVTRHLGKAR